MNGLTRRKFVQSASAMAGAGLLSGNGLGALAQDPVVDTERAANHMGYEAVPWKAKPFPLRQVRLLYGPLREAQERNRVYLYMLPNDRLLHSFRLTAGRPSTAHPLGGWEAPDGELRGHFIGHYLSACAMMYASTGDTQYKDNALKDLIPSLTAACSSLTVYANKTNDAELVKKSSISPSDWNAMRDTLLRDTAKAVIDMVDAHASDLAEHGFVSEKCFSHHGATGRCNHPRNGQTRG